jgi:hypothetical protein
MKKILFAFVFLTIGITNSWADSLDRLAAKLSANPMWENGMFPTLDLPATATADQVVAKVLKSVSFDKGRVKTYKILKTKQLQIRGSLPNLYTASLLDTDLGKKILLYKYSGAATGWWSRVFEAEAAE